MRCIAVLRYPHPAVFVLRKHRVNRPLPHHLAVRTIHTDHVTLQSLHFASLLTTDSIPRITGHKNTITHHNRTRNTRTRQRDLPLQIPALTKLHRQRLRIRTDPRAVRTTKSRPVRRHHISSRYKNSQTRRHQQLLPTLASHHHCRLPANRNGLTQTAHSARIPMTPACTAKFHFDAPSRQRGGIARRVTPPRGPPRPSKRRGGTGRTVLPPAPLPVTRSPRQSPRNGGLPKPRCTGPGIPRSNLPGPPPNAPGPGNLGPLKPGPTNPGPVGPRPPDPIPNPNPRLPKRGPPPAGPPK